MTRARREAVSEQFELFLPYLADLPLRDQREMMERPFFSLAKSKRVNPIDFRMGEVLILVEATADLVQEKGPQAFTLTEAARRAGVSPAAPYRHFKGRDDLLEEVARQGFIEFAARLEAARPRVEAADRAIVVTDSSKLGVDHLHSFAPLSAIDLVITDDAAERDLLAETGVEVVYA